METKFLVHYLTVVPRLIFGGCRAHRLIFHLLLLEISKLVVIFYWKFPVSGWNTLYFLFVLKVSFWDCGVTHVHQDGYSSGVELFRIMLSLNIRLLTYVTTAMTVIQNFRCLFYEHINPYFWTVVYSTAGNFNCCLFCIKLSTFWIIYGLKNSLYIPNSLPTHMILKCIYTPSHTNISTFGGVPRIVSLMHIYGTDSLVVFYHMVILMITTKN